MILSSILDGIASVLQVLFDLIPGFDVDFSKLTSSFDLFLEYVKKANRIVPVDTMLTVIGLFVGYAIAMAGLYAAVRIINLLRGSG